MANQASSSRVSSLSKTGSVKLIGDVTLSEGSNITLTQTGQDIEIASTGSSSPLTTKGDIYTYSTMDTRLPVGTDGQVLSANSATTTGLEWIAAGGTGTVTSIASGNGMNFSTITTTGTVTLGTPSTLSVSSSNALTSNSHTHAITSSSAPGAAASILATDSSGIIGSTGTRIVKIWATDLTVTNAIAGSITGNAATATALATPRTIGIATGDVTSSGSAFDGTANNTNAYTLATVNSDVGSFTNASITVNAKGLVTAASSGASPVTSVSGTTDRITVTGTTSAVVDIAATYVGQSSITTLGTITTGVWNGTDVALSAGGTGASLVDPGADRILFWDDSNSTVDWLTAGSGLSISGTTITATGLGGDVVGPSSATDNAIARYDGTTGKLLKDSVLLLTGSAGNATLTASTSVTIVGTSGGIALNPGGATFPTVNGVDVVTISGSQTLSNKTLTAPKFANAGYIADANGNEEIIFTTTSSAVNEFTVANAATGNSPTLSATGGDTNIGMVLAPKGTGGVTISATSSGVGKLTLDNGDTGTGTTLSATTGPGSFTLTLPGITDTLVTKTSTDTLTNKTMTGSSNVIDVSSIDLTSFPTSIGAWSTYTPTVSSISGSFTTTSATGSYWRFGKTVVVTAVVTITTVGTGVGIRFTLPVNSNGNVTMGSYREVAVGGLTGVAVVTSSTQATLFEYDNSQSLSNGMVFSIFGIYQAA